MKKKFLFILLVIACTGMIRAESEEPKDKIRAVEFSGLRNVKVSVVKNAVKVSKGDFYDPKIINEDISSLYKLGLFSDVTAGLSEFQDGVKVTFSFQEKLIIKTIEFKGNKEFSSRKRDTLILSNINLALLESKPGYIMYLQKDENSDMSSLYMHRIATNEKIRLIHLETNGVRISSDWSRLAYRVILGNGNYQEDLSNFYIVNLDPDKNDDLQAHISSESNTYKTIKDTF